MSDMVEKTGSKNAIASMTGYGRSTGESPLGRVTVEIRSLNHRYLDVSVRVPRTLMLLDPEIRSLVRDRVSRGKVEVFVTLEEQPQDLAIDTARALKIAGSLQEVAGNIGDTVRLEHILMAGEVITSREVEAGPEVASVVLSTVGSALDSLVAHRVLEGQALARDIKGRAEELESITDRIEGLAPEVTERVRQQAGRFLSELDLGEHVDPQRLEAEVALLSQRSDISEEITRLKAHLASFSVTLSTGGVAGRRLDFLVQEIQREVNTIGSKSSHPAISELVVDFKTSLEKIREQAQNIE